MQKSNITCPLCQKSQKQFVESKTVYGGNINQNYICCKDCDFYYLTPKPTEEELSDFYVNNFENFMDKRSGDDSNWKEAEAHIAIQKRESERRFPFLDDKIQENITILEVGASTGFMLNAIKDREPTVTAYALEPSKQFSLYLEKSGYKCFREPIEIPIELKFDLIIHFFVIAHVHDFEEFLLFYLSKLKKGGTMIFETPSATDALYQLYDIPEFKKFYWQVAHLISFTNKSMKKFLDKYNLKYEIIAHQRYDLSNHMVWMQNGKPGGRDKYKNVFTKQVEFEYKESLEKKWLCDSMIVKIYK